MLISCEKCSTTYVLDDGLIPPGGAPVQCTRCGNVFTAKPAAVAAPEPTPAPSRADPAANTTMMFGAAPVTAPGPVPAASSRAASQTMVFGSSPFASAPPQAAGAPNTTMMFGTPASNAAAAAADSAPAAPKPNQTMVFGSGTKPTSPPPTFGPSGGSQGASFGPPSAGPGAPPNPNQTMMFGLNPAGAPVPAKPAVATTAMFGAVAAPAAAASKPAAVNTTMMFGKPAEEPAGGLNKTMAFGVQQPPPQGSGAGRSTMIFGAADAKAAMPKVTAGGSVPVAAQITESTVRVDVDAMMRERGQAAEAVPGGERHNRTQLFALNDARGGEKTPPEAFDSPLAGAEAQLDAPPSEQAPGVRHERTQLFSMSSKPAANAPPARDLSTDTNVTLPPDNAMRQTMMFGAPNNADTAPGLPGVTPELLKMPISGATTSPNLAGLGSHDLLLAAESQEGIEASLDSLPEHSPESSQDLAPAGEDSGDQFSALESSTRRRNMLAVIVLLVALLAAAAAITWTVVSRQMINIDGPTKVPNPKTAPEAPK